MLDDDFEEQEEIQQAEPATPREIHGSAERPLRAVVGSRGNQ